MSAQKSTPEVSHTPEDVSTPVVPSASPGIPFTDPRLRFAYPIIEVAKIAASLNRGNMRDRVYGAIALLEATERHALNPDPVKSRNWEIFRSASAKREKKNGLIRQTDLIVDICAAVGQKCEPETAREKYREWLKEDWEINAIDYEIHEGRAVSLEEYAASYETGKKRKFVITEAAALVIIERFSKWLEDNKSSHHSIEFRDADTGQAVSEKDKGAGRAADYKYDKKTKR